MKVPDKSLMHKNSKLRAHKERMTPLFGSQPLTNCALLVRLPAQFAPYQGVMHRIRARQSGLPLA
jgi:hypothetical protein